MFSTQDFCQENTVWLECQWAWKHLNIRANNHTLHCHLPPHSKQFAIVHSAAQEIGIQYCRCEGAMCRIVSQCNPMAVHVARSTNEETVKPIQWGHQIHSVQVAVQKRKICDSNGLSSKHNQFEWPKHCLNLFFKGIPIINSEIQNCNAIIWYCKYNMRPILCNNMIK